MTESTDSTQSNHPPTSPAPSSTVSSAPRAHQQEERVALPGDLLVAWAETWVIRSRPYALQQPDGTYRWRHADCTPDLLVAHLAGTCTLALSSTDARGWCKWACLDADAPEAFPPLRRLRTALAERGLPGILEASRRGGHLWLLLDAAVPAALLRQVVLATLDELHQAGLDVWGLGLELYPDAASAQPGTLGHAVRLPLGIHRLAGKRYPLFEADGTPCVFTTPEAAMRWVLEAPRVHAIDLVDRAVKDEQPTCGQGLQGLSESHREHREHREHGERQGKSHARSTATTSSSESPEMPMSSATPPETPELGMPRGRIGRIGTSSGVIRWVDAQISALELLDEFAPGTDVRRVGQGYLGWCPFHNDRAADHLGRPGTRSFYVVHSRRYGWSWRCLSTNCGHHAGPMRHAFRLWQELQGLSVADAMKAAVARWPEAGDEADD